MTAFFVNSKRALRSQYEVSIDANIFAPVVDGFVAGHFVECYMASTYDFPPRKATPTPPGWSKEEQERLWKRCRRKANALYFIVRQSWTDLMSSDNEFVVSLREWEGTFAYRGLGLAYLSALHRLAHNMTISQWRKNVAEHAKWRREEMEKSWRKRKTRR